MSRVLVHPLNILGAAPGISDATQFADNLQPADQPFIYGNQWFCCQYQFGGVTGVSDQLAARVNRAGAGLQITGGGGGSIIFRCMGIPRPLSFLQVDGHNQFAQVTIVSDTSAGVNDNTVGIGVYMQSNQSTLYSLMKNPQGTTAGIGILKSVGGADTLLGGIHAVNANDVMRLEVRTAAGVNTLKALINGVVVETQTDNQLIPPGGMPGLHILACFTGGQVTTFANFSCGLLTT
jgi:hypothetical protein